VLPKVTAEQQAGTVVPVEVASARLGTAPPERGVKAEVPECVLVKYRW
jgi:hypothetical protein